MIWLASFPRSGNTFFRIVLEEVFGVPSSSHNGDIDRELNPDYADYAVVKTHLEPDKVVPADPGIPSVCLVRDGRDSLVSLAHHAKDMHQHRMEFRDILIEAIVAPKGGHFGGWSKNVGGWLERADLVLKFEDLIADPIATVGRLSEIMDLPAPKPERLPTFENLRSGRSHNGSGSVEMSLDPQWRQKFFRRGKSGSWKDEMPDDLHQLFWSLHGDVMRRLGYTDGMIDAPSPLKCLGKIGLWRWWLRPRIGALKRSLLGHSKA